MSDMTGGSAGGETFQQTAMVECDTTAGPFSMRLVREWSPNGYDRAVELFKRGFFDESHFFRVVPHFLVQFGISYTKDRELKQLANKAIADDQKFDPPIEFKEGTISYAGSGPNSRTSQLFISYGKVASLGRELWETPVGEVVEGMESIRGLNNDYGDMPPWGHGPVQGKIHGGREYIDQEFPKLDSFIKCLVTEAQPGDNDMEEDGFVTVDEESDVKIKAVALDIEVDDEVVVEPSAEVEKRIGSPTKRVERIISEEGVLAATAADDSDVNTIVMVSGGIFLAVLIILVMVSHFKLRRAKHNKAS